MGLFQNLLETYKKCEDIIGVVKTDENGEVNEKKTFLPIYHQTFKARIFVTLNERGEFQGAELSKLERTIIIPCTDKSAGRSSGIAAHPLCDRLDYVGNLNEDKTNVYLSQLDGWRKYAAGAAKAKLDAVYTYVASGALIADLISEGLYAAPSPEMSDKEKDALNEKNRKLGVGFCVEVAGDLTPNVWEDKVLRQSWIDYIKNASVIKADGLFDYLTGETVSSVAAQHPKNINSMCGNAKLLSCNDASGLTFRGRFDTQDSAVIVDAEQSQKMHQTLRWLINNYGYAVDTQVIVVWAIDKIVSPPVTPYADTYVLFRQLPKSDTDNDRMTEAEVENGADYSKKLRAYLQGYGKTKDITDHKKRIGIAVFDAATTGRMGLTFYREFPEDDYLENVVKWHEETSYYLTAWVRDDTEKGEVKFFEYVGAPSFDDILFAVYGKKREKKDAVKETAANEDIATEYDGELAEDGKKPENNGGEYDIMKKRIRKQMLECMFGDFSFPKSIVETAAFRASNPMSFTNDGSFARRDWNKSINITCALIRKYYKKENKEISMELEEQRTDRDYLYGRLLALAEALEYAARYKQWKEKQQKPTTPEEKLEQTVLYKEYKAKERISNAARLMSAFSVKPFSTWGDLFIHLIPYKDQLRLGRANFYQQKINEVLTLFKPGEYEDNRQLSPLYLLGYAAQSRALYHNGKNIEENENDVE
ncbi:MAG: type I-C CRISPR-associated protein Cas8c/Csd1 [Clostridiales bacterium]|jgi:CRISPR-associated protein Csd1|nr:type I-C CRISPR-associated protein Cas8c/Csd1 [Clostridiales bacterium]